MEPDKFLRAFAKLDLNHDNRLSQQELDQAVIDPSIDLEFAEIVATLKANFQEIAELHKDGWFGRQINITLADILIFEQILQGHCKVQHRSKIGMMTALLHKKPHITDPKTLASVAFEVMKRVRDISEQRLTLYKDQENPLLYIKADAIRQGIIGDCFFLAALGAVTATNPQIITRIIKDNHNQTYTITFPGLRYEPITVDAPSIVELALYARLTEWGTWPAVMEKAYGKYLARFEKRPKLVNAENTGGAEHLSEALQLLTGQLGKVIYLPNLSQEELIRLLTDAFREKRALGASTKPSKSGYTEDANIPASHAYSIVGWDRDSAVITLRNPWGPSMYSEPELENGEPVDGELDGFFTMGLPQFRLNFDFLSYEEWMPEDGFIDGFEAPPNSIIKNIGHQH